MSFDFLPLHAGCDTNVKRMALMGMALTPTSVSTTAVTAQKKIKDFQEHGTEMTT